MAEKSAEVTHNHPAEKYEYSIAVPLDELEKIYHNEDELLKKYLDANLYNLVKFL